jgi:serine/threonine protein kinase
LKDDTFVLKRYPNKDGEDDYKAEVNGFRSVKSTDSIIKFYGSYIHGDEFNILLQYGDRGSLEEYFKRETPPSRGLDIIKFWEAMFKLIEGLKVIHSVREWASNDHLICSCANNTLADTMMLNREA